MLSCSKCTFRCNVVIVIVTMLGGGGGGVWAVCFFFNDTATTEIYTLSLHDALPIFEQLPPLFGKYWDNIEARTCDHCGAIQEPPS